MSYDHWKTTNPDDQFLESSPQSQPKPLIQNPDPLDVANWALKILKYQGFDSQDHQEFFQAFRIAYHHALAQIKELINCRLALDENSKKLQPTDPYHEPTQKDYPSPNPF